MSMREKVMQVKLPEGAMYRKAKVAEDGTINIFYEEQMTIEGPIDGKWFVVVPNTINRELFKQERKDPLQESTRKLILEAFEENEKCWRKDCWFQLLIEPKTIIKDYSPLQKYEQMAKDYGHHTCMANWIDQALEWAQRIHNGETWEEVCNAITQITGRMIKWKNEDMAQVGGFRLELKSGGILYNKSPNAFVQVEKSDNLIRFRAPLIVEYFNY